MKIQEHVSLKPFNTFGIDAKAAYFAEPTTEAELRDLLTDPIHPSIFILGGGSNMLLTQDMDALVIHLKLMGKQVFTTHEHSVEVKIMAGENWHQTVLWSLDQGFGGLENLSLIPGNIGAAPIQNIGAYGVELKDVFVSCEAMDLATQEIKTFTKEACQFGYRDSIFKRAAKGRYAITSVNLKLTRDHHQLNTSYGAIEQQLQHMGVTDPTIKDVSNAVIAIRQQKLPDPKILGNSGSFFKNPVISHEEFKEFAEKHPEAPFYKVSDHEYKIPAGWLIEQCGFKGKRFGDAGVHAQQALVLVNYGDATGQEVLDLARTIQQQVLDTFGIAIEAEVNLI